MKKLLSILITISLMISAVACASKPVSQVLQDDDRTSFDKEFSNDIIATPAEAFIKDEGLYAPAQELGSELFGYIDIHGNWVIEPKFMAATPFSEGFALVLDEYNEYCLINKRGEILLSTYQNKTIAEASCYSEGLIALKLDTGYPQSYIYLDTELNNPFSAKIIKGVSGRSYKNQLLFGFATPFTDGKALVMKLANADITDKKDPESAYVINKAGEVLAQLPAGLDPDDFGFDDQGNVIVRNSDNLFGICDSEGNLKVECQYRKLQHCDGKLYLVCNDSGFFGFIDSEGNKIIDFKYQKAMPFSGGYAAVYNGTYWGLIDENGDVISDFLFEDVAPLQYAKLTCNINKGAVAEGVMGVLKDGKWMLLSSDGEKLSSIAQTSYKSYTGIAYTAVENGYVSFKGVAGDIDASGVLNLKGELVISPKFESIGLFR